MFGLDVKIINTQEGTSTERRFERFPIRIGRNALNDLQIDSGYVSQFHAILQLSGEQVHLVDLGSRNGTLLPGIGRVQPNAIVDLETSNYEFAIAMTIFRVSLVNLDVGALSRRRGGVHDIAEEMTRPHGTDVGAAMVTHLKPMYDAYRQAWARLYQEIQTTIGTYDAEMRQRFCEDLMIAHPNVAAEPDFKRLANISPPSSAPSGSHQIHVDIEMTGSALDPPREEAVALHGLKQLAQWYMPGAAPPTGVEDIIGFLQTLQDTLDVFLKCFVPLRDGYKQFEVQMDIQRARGEGVRVGSSVEVARDPRELARAMLDWRRTVGDEPRIVENTFADLMTHQVAMLNGIMKGVKSLLSELSPETIEKTLDDPRKNRGRQGLQIGPFRYKQLWELYMERHGDLSSEDKEAFALIFGPQFALAYSQFQEGAGGGVIPTTSTVELSNVSAAIAEGHRGLSNATQPPPQAGPPGPYWPPRR